MYGVCWRPSSFGATVEEHHIGMYVRVMAPHPTGACALGLMRAKDEDLCMVYVCWRPRSFVSTVERRSTGGRMYVRFVAPHHRCMHAGSYKDQR